MEVYKESYKNHLITIHQDDDADSPDIWENDFCFLVYEHRDFTIKKKNFEPSEIFDWLEITNKLKKIKDTPTFEEGIYDDNLIEELEDALKDYYDYSDGTSIYFQNSSGFTSDMLTAVPITKDELLLKIQDQPQIVTDVFVERGKNSVYQQIQRLGEVSTLSGLINYGYGYYTIENKG
jgi:hypothetical protein